MKSEDKFFEQIKKMKEYAVEKYIPILRPQSSQILCDMVSNLKPAKALEIGTAIGYSASLILHSSPNTKLISIEKDAERLTLAKENLKEMELLENVTLINADANEEVKNLQDNFDFIFLDGPKSHYIKQLPYLLEHLNIGGVLLADNVLFLGEVMSNSMPKHKHRTAILRLREFLQAIEENSSLESKLIEIEDGLLIAKKVK